jgi:hypothetical protein
MLIREGLLALDDLLQVGLHQLRDQIHIDLLWERVRFWSSLQASKKLNTC